jgi:MFS family permease
MPRDPIGNDQREMSGSRMRNVALFVAGCFFMELLDGTIVVTAIPRISSSLGITAGAAGLVVNAYLVTVALLIPLSAWLTLRYRYRRVLLSAIAIFTLASLGCAASQTLGELVAMRVLQAVGGAMMVPVGRMIAFERADKSQVMRLMSFIVWPARPVAGDRQPSRGQHRRVKLTAPSRGRQRRPASTAGRPFLRTVPAQCTM